MLRADIPSAVQRLAPTTDAADAGQPVVVTVSRVFGVGSYFLSLRLIDIDSPTESKPMPLNKFIKVFLPYIIFAGVVVVAAIAVGKQYDVESSIIIPVCSAIIISSFSNAIKSAYRLGISDAGNT